MSDADRSAAFYRDVLGFEVRDQEGELEAVHGPAAIRFGALPAGALMLFFECSDLSAMHEFIRSRGGNPSGIEKVNWIKMRMFAVRDPDGHTLWFGQSYNVPDQPAPPPLFLKGLPSLPLDDVAAGIAHYRDVLGFRVDYQQHDLGVMYRDEVTILLIARTELHKGIASAYFYIANADRFYAELKERGANLRGEPVSQPWGLREFRVLDLENNELRFGQPFE